MTRQELRYAAGWAAAIMLLTVVPYFVVWFFLPLEHVFPGILFNSDDHGVYFSWMRQARDGHFLIRNLFTTEPQRGVYLQLYFLVLGWLSRLPGLDIPLAYHLGRILFGWLTLVLVYRLGAFFTADRFERRCVFWVTALSAGFGWLYWTDRITQGEPVDVWQPEALTFPSLHTNSLFCVSLALMLGVVVCLLAAEERGWRWAAGAGLCGLLLGNIHSYDVIHLALAWAAYLAAKGFAERRVPVKELGYALLAAAIAAPSVGYMYWLYKTEPVFTERANKPTLSPPIRLYLLGYGLLLPLAAWGAVLLVRRKEEPDGAGRGRKLLPIVWAVTGFIAAYLPFAFQRKMIMGEHLPLALLAGIAVAALSRRLAVLAARPRLAPLVAAAVVALLAPSNILYLVRDVRLALTQNVTSTGIHRVFWPEADIRAFQWLSDHAPPDAALLTYPTTGVLAPAFTGRPVYTGHWGETPGFEATFPLVARFFSGRMTSAERMKLLQENGIDYVLAATIDRREREAGGGIPIAPPLGQEPFLTPVFTQGDTTLYQVR